MSARVKLEVPPQKTDAAVVIVGCEFERPSILWCDVRLRGSEDVLRFPYGGIVSAPFTTVGILPDDLGWGEGTVAAFINALQPLARSIALDIPWGESALSRKLLAQSFPPVCKAGKVLELVDLVLFPSGEFGFIVSVFDNKTFTSLRFRGFFSELERLEDGTVDMVQTVIETPGLTEEMLLLISDFGKELGIFILHELPKLPDDLGHNGLRFGPVLSPTALRRKKGAPKVRCAFAYARISSSRRIAKGEFEVGLKFVAERGRNFNFLRLNLRIDRESALLRYHFVYMGKGPLDMIEDGLLQLVLHKLALHFNLGGIQAW